MIRRALTFACVAALAACSLEPHYTRPQPLVPPSWPKGDAYLRASEAALPAISYTDIFRDPHLQAIIGQALAHNQDLRAALANIAASRALYRVQRAQQLPQIGANSGITLGDRGAGSTTSAPTVSRGFGADYSVGVGLTSFEIDLFGRLRSLSHAAFDAYLGTEAAARSVRLTLVADVASAYLTLATDRSLLAIAVATQASAGRSVELTRARLNGGVAPRTDLTQAETVLDQARSDRAAQVTLVAQDRNALELLVGAPVDDALLPASIEAVDGEVAVLPAGIDSRILLRRPDVVEAEYVLLADNARIGAARAAFFPTINLTAAAGFASTALTSLFTGGAFSYSAGPAASVPIFDGGANRGNLAYARAERELATAQYQKAIQGAFRDVANALAREGTIDDQVQAQTDLEAAARESNTLEFARYREGIDPFLNTLDTQRTLYAASRALASARLIRATNRVTLYSALGGDELINPGTGPVAPVQNQTQSN